MPYCVSRKSARMAPALGRLLDGVAVKVNQLYIRYYYEKRRSTQGSI